MTPEQEASIQRTIERHNEIFEGVQARKGPLYAMQCATFLACAKNFDALFNPPEADHRRFCYNLLECMGYTSNADRLEFLHNVDIMRKAQKVNI